MTINTFNREQLAKKVTVNSTGKASFLALIDGKRRRVHCDSLDDAIHKLYEYRLGIQAKRKSKPSAATLGGTIALYIHGLKKQKSKERYLLVEKALYCFFTPETRIASVTVEDVQEFIAKRKETFEKRWKRPLAPNSLRVDLCFLRRMLGKHIPNTKNPVHVDLIPKKEAKRPTPIAEWEINKFLANCNNVRFKYLMHIVYLTGMRRMEVNSLRPCDINFETRTYTIQGEHRKGKGENKLSDTRPMRQEAADVMREWIELNDVGLQEPLFGYGELNTITKYAAKWRKKLGLTDNFYVHGGRHTAITREVLRGQLTGENLMRFSGHEDMNSLQLYLQHTAEDVAQLMTD